MCYKDNWILRYQHSLYSRHSIPQTSFSISRSIFTAKSRPCCDTLFLLFASNIPPITSALYPYVQTLASGMSSVRYSSGQNTVALLGPSIVEVAGGGFDLKRDLKVLSLLGAIFSIFSLFTSPLSAHVCLGCPLRPCTKTMLCHVSMCCPT